MTNPMLTIARYHLRKHLWSRSFLFAVMGMPLLILVSGTIGALSATMAAPQRIGAADPGGVLGKLPTPEENSDANVALVIFSTRADGMKALETDLIDGLYVLPANYPQDKTVELIYRTPPGWQAQDYFVDLLRVNLLQKYPVGIIERVNNPPTITIHSLETQRVFTSSGPNAGSLVPTILSAIFTLSLFPISEMLVGTLGDEKSNRTMEIMLTSIKPFQLIGGKLIAAAGVVMALNLIWMGMLSAAYGVIMIFWPQEWLKNIQVAPGDVLQIVLLMVSGLVFTASLLIFVGAILQGDEEVKQAAGLIILPFMLPIYVLPILLQGSNSPIGVLLALLPFSSTQAIGIQSLFEAQSWWKVLAAFGLHVAFSAVFVWLGALAFRRGMLRYGQNISLRELFSRDNRGSTAHE